MKWATIFVIFSIATMLLDTANAMGVRCYVCSWSPGDYSNRTRKCLSDTEFDQEHTHVALCEFGCELHAQRDINGALEHVRRNCASKEVNSPTCTAEKTKAWSLKKCYCATDYCNDGNRNRNSIATLIAIIASVTLSFYQH